MERAVPHSRNSARGMGSGTICSNVEVTWCKMKTNKVIWTGIGIALLLVLATLHVYGSTRQDAEDAEFLRALTSLSQDSAGLETMATFQSVERSGGGWFRINGYDSNPANDIYYTVGPVQFAGFASSTGLTREQVDELTNVLQKYSFIARIENNVNISGECANNTNNLHRCTALEFYPPIGLYRLWFTDPASWHSSGHLYIPFQLSASNQSYLQRYFQEVMEIAPNWYSFT